MLLEVILPKPPTMLCPFLRGWSGLPLAFNSASFYWYHQFSHVPCLQDVWYLHAHHIHRISSHLWPGSCFLLAHASEIGGGGLFHAYYFCTSSVHASRPLSHVTLLKKVSSHLHRLSTTFHTTGHCRLPGVVGSETNMHTFTLTLPNIQ